MGARARFVALALICCLTPAASAAASPSWDAVRAAEPSTRTIVPARLGRGPDASVPYMQDGVIHADRRTIPIRTPVNGEQRQLLGESRKGWLVAVRKGYVSRVVAVRAGRAPVEIRHTRITSYGEGDTAVGWLASRDGKMLVSTTYDRGGSTRSVQDLAGKRLSSTSTGAYFTPFDADAGHVVTWAENKFYRLRVFDWIPRTSTTQIAVNATFVSLRDDLMFVRTSGRRYGPSSIVAPSTPAWSQPFSPLAISPDGATAVGLRLSRSGFDSPAVLDVRRMSDGALLDSIAFGRRITQDTWSITAQHEQTAAWEDDDTYVFQLGTPSGAVLVRCTLVGRCERASDTGGDVTTPYESFMWW